MTKYEEENFVTIPVPKSRAEEVFRLLGTPKADDAPSPPILKKRVSSNTVIKHGDIEWWTKDRISKLKREITNPTLIDLLGLLSRRPGEWVDFDELCDTIIPHLSKRLSVDKMRRLDIMLGEVRTSLAGMTRIIKRLFHDNKQGWWPIKVRHRTPPIAYRMPVEIADRWKEA